MIVEGKKLTAFDLMEACVNLSDAYKVNNPRKFVNFRFSGIRNALNIDFGEWNGFEIVNESIFSIQLDDLSIGNSFSEVFLKIEKEMEELES